MSTSFSLFSILFLEVKCHSKIHHILLHIKELLKLVFPQTFASITCTLLCWERRLPAPRGRGGQIHCACTSALSLLWAVTSQGLRCLQEQEVHWGTCPGMGQGTAQEPLGLLEGAGPDRLTSHGKLKPGHQLLEANCRNNFVSTKMQHSATGLCLFSSGKGPWSPLDHKPNLLQCDKGLFEPKLYTIQHRTM